MFKIGDRVRIKKHIHSDMMIDSSFTIINIEQSRLLGDSLILNKSYFKNDNERWYLNTIMTSTIHESYVELDKDYYRKLKIIKLKEKLNEY